TFGFSIAQLRAGKRPARPNMVVKVPEPTKVVGSIEDMKGVFDMTKEQADKAIKYLSAVWVAADKKGEEETKKLVGIVADALRVATDRKAVNGYEK
ncbi:hypothetical protein P4T20_04845, partial [Aneurinibacillus thermoaerophilus]|nr:hypothetical protein [Aneurinibacillus thermoaerophilus]